MSRLLVAAAVEVSIVFIFFLLMLGFETLEQAKNRRTGYIQLGRLHWSYFFSFLHVVALGFLILIVFDVGEDRSDDPTLYWTVLILVILYWVIYILERFLEAYYPKSSIRGI